MFNFDILWYTLIIIGVCLLFYLDDYQRYKWLFTSNNILLSIVGVISIILAKHLIKNNAVNI
jgi:hypothetical protein